MFFRTVENTVITYGSRGTDEHTESANGAINKDTNTKVSKSTAKGK